MEPPKPPKPNLPRLTTNLPPEEHGRISVFATRTPSPDSNIKPERPERPAGGPSLFPDENIAPRLRYAPSLRTAMHVKPNISEDPPVMKKPEAKSAYYEEQFSSRGSHNSPRDRVIQDSVVVAELTTSAKIQSPGTLQMDLSRHLALVYQRPEAAILLTIHQDASLSFSNISLPAYLLKIYALPTLIAPTTNMRSSAMLSNELHELLDIPPELGVILFIPVPADNLAGSGSTTGAEVAKLERTEQEDSPSLIRSLGKSISRRRLKSSSGGTSEPISPAVLSSMTSPSSGRTPRSANYDDIATVERRHQLGVKQSVQNFMRRRLRDKPAPQTEEQESENVEKKDTVKPKKERVRFDDQVEEREIPEEPEE